MSSDIDVVAYLASKGLHGKQANGPEVAYPCFFDCGEAPDSRKKKLYVNAEEGFFDCKVCGAHGGTYLLQQHFGDDPKASVTSDNSFNRRKILDWAADAGSTMLEHNDDVLLYLINQRGLDVDTILSRKIGFIAKNWSLTGSLPEQFTREQLKGTGLVWPDGNRAGQDFFYHHILIPYVHRGHVVQIRGRAWGESNAKYATGPGDSPRLFGAEDLDGAEECIITEGEFDAMVLKQHLNYSLDERPKKIAVVGLAGTNALPDNFESYFTDLKRIFIGFDAEKSQTGLHSAEKLKERLGKRARIVTLPFDDTTAKKCDWTEYLLPVPDNADALWHAEHPYAGHSWIDVMSLLGEASGKRVFSVAEAGAAFRAYRAVNSGLKTGFPSLDTTIAPGLLPGQLMVFLAKTGTGKTVFICNMAVNMREHKQLIVTLEMTREEVYDRLRRMFLFHHPLATDAELEHELRNIYICDENRLREQDLATLLDEFNVETGSPPDVVYIDYLGYYARSAQGTSQYEKVTNAVMSLKAAAKAQRCVIVAPAQVNRLAKEGKPIDLDDARDSGAIEETADFLFSLYRPDDVVQADGTSSMAQHSGRMKMAVLKSRHGGKDKDWTYQFDLLTLAIVETGTPAARRAEQHCQLSWQGVTWDALRADQTRPRQPDLTGKVPDNDDELHHRALMEQLDPSTRQPVRRDRGGALARR